MFPSPSHCGWRPDDQLVDIPAIQSTSRPSSAVASTPCCSFAMIRASFPTVVGKPGVFALYMSKGIQRASDYEQGQLISVGSGLYARAVAADQSSRSAGRSESRPGRMRPATALTALNSTSPSTTGPRRDRIMRPKPSMCKSPVQPAALPVTAQPAHERPRGPTPCNRDYTRKE